MIEELFFDALHSAFVVEGGSEWDAPEGVVKGMREAHLIRLNRLLKRLEYILANELIGDPWSLDEFLDHKLESLINLRSFLAKRKKEE